MVHLNKVQKRQGRRPPPSQTDEDTLSGNVYGTRFAAEELPHHEIAEREMPPEVAYRMIKDELSLDGNPLLKYVYCDF